MAGLIQFGSIAGMEQAKEALLLLAVEPALQGVLIAAGPGMGKSSLARAFGGLAGPFVEIPAGVSEDRLLGGLNLEGSLRTGKREVQAGLLARADGGVAYVDDADLLEPWTAQQIADALNRRVVALEREGVSARVATRFSLVASYCPGERDIHPALADALALHVIEDGPKSIEDRLAVLKGIASRRDDGVKQRIDRARELLPAVGIAPEDERRLIMAAASLGVQGHRADVFAVRTARARAAWHGRETVQEDDIEAALRLVLYPRATAIPENERHQAQQHAEPGSGDPQEGESQTIAAVDATAPPDVIRASERKAAQRSTRGRYVRPVARDPGSARIAWEATLRAAAPFQRMRGGGGGPIQLRPDDLRFKLFRQEAGILVVFAVDASGSMASYRMHQVKGAAIDLLQKAYLRRAEVALVTFRGSRAEVALRPTRSVALAKRAVEAMPAGGGTPLAAGLEAALRVAIAHGAADRDTLLVLLTDGRANVARTASGVREDLEQACAAVRANAIASVVIDTGNRLISAGEAETIAAWLGARCVSLPRADATGISGAVHDEILRLRHL